MEKINKFFTKDIGLKLISVIIAIGLWYMVINIENPIESKSITVNVTTTNLSYIEDMGYDIVNKDDLSSLQTTLKVRSNRLSLDRLVQSKDKITANLDFSKINTSELSEGKVYVKVDVTLPTIAGSNFEILSRNPDTFMFDVSEVVEESKPVEVLLSDEPTDEYIVSDFTTTPENVTLKGTKVALSELDKVAVTVSPNDFNTDGILYAEPQPLDKEGNVIPNITISPKEVIVKGGISKTKTVPIYLDTTGTLADGYVVSKFDYNPKEITVIGSEEALDDFDKIILPSVDISGVNSNLTGEYLLNNFLSQGIMVNKGENGTLIFELSVSTKSTKQITIPAENISLSEDVPPDTSVNYNKEDINITVVGEETVLSSLTGNSIFATINISNLDEGTHIVEYTFNLPDGVTIEGNNPTVTVTIEKT